MNGGFGIGWRQVGISFVMLATTAMIAATYSLVAVPLGREFHPDRMTLMLAMTVLSGVSALLAPFAGNLMDKAPLRLLLAMGGLCIALGYASLSIAQSFNHVLVVFALLIAPANVLLGPTAATVLLSRWFSARRGRALGIAIAGISAGSFFYPLIVGGLLEAFPWREALRWLALVLLAVTIPAALLVVERPGDRGLYPDGAPAPPAGEEGGAGPPIAVMRVLTDPAFWMLVLLMAVVTSGMKGMITNLAPLAMDEGVSARDAAFLISIYAIGGFCAKLFFAAFADRLGPRLMMVLGLGGFATGITCLSQASMGYAMIALGVGLMGMFGGLIVPLESLLVPRVFGRSAIGRVMGLMSSVSLVALLSTPPLFGRMYDLTGSYQAICLIFAALAVLTMAVIPLIRLGPRPVAGAPTPSAG